MNSYAIHAVCYTLVAHDALVLCSSRVCLLLGLYFDCLRDSARALLAVKSIPLMLICQEVWV